VVLEKLFKGKVDARQMDPAPCHKLTWPFGPGELKTELIRDYIDQHKSTDFYYNLKCIKSLV